jgi:hypothetical protein
LIDCHAVIIVDHAVIIVDHAVIIVDHAVIIVDHAVACEIISRAILILQIEIVHRFGLVLVPGQVGSLILILIIPIGWLLVNNIIDKCGLVLLAQILRILVLVLVLISPTHLVIILVFVILLLVAKIFVASGKQMISIFLASAHLSITVHHISPSVALYSRIENRPTGILNVWLVMIEHDVILSVPNRVLDIGPNIIIYIAIDIAANESLISTSVTIHSKIGTIGPVIVTIVIVTIMLSIIPIVIVILSIPVIAIVITESGIIC